MTVLMPVYNRERFVSEAIESVLAQELADIELLVVDDGSTDRTPEILREWARRNRKVVVIALRANQGIPSALNVGLRHARAPYVARLDSDDVMVAGRLVAQAAVLDTQPDVVLVGCAYDVITADGKFVRKVHSDEPHEVIAHLLNFYNAAGGGSRMMFRRQTALEVGGFASECRVSSDYDLWIRLLRKGRFNAVPVTGIKLRDHAERVSHLYACLKHPIWMRIMRDVLSRYLQRSVTLEEIEALITVWRLDGRLGMAPVADRVMRETYARFCSEHADPRLRKRLLSRTSYQWMLGALHFARTGHFVEAMRFMIRAVRGGSFTSSWVASTHVAARVSDIVRRRLSLVRLRAA